MLKMAMKVLLWRAKTKFNKATDDVRKFCKKVVATVKAILH